MKRYNLNLNVLLLCVSVLFSQVIAGKVYYVATNGSDSNPGTKSRPFATINKARGYARAGDTIYVRGGRYTNAGPITLSGGGSSGHPVCLFAYPGEKPVLYGSRGGTALLYLSGARYWHIKGLEICYNKSKSSFAWGVAIATNSGNNLLELLNIHHNNGAGLIILGTNNTILNCDSHHNADNQDGADGFTAANPGSKNNLFKGCRSWQNCDDGFDVWMSVNTTFEECWAFKTGFNDAGKPWTKDTDGNGFKLGKGSGLYVAKNCMSWKNMVTGFDYNKGVNIRVYNCVSWDNPLKNFLFTVPTHKIRNCVSFGKGHTHISGDHKYNSWDLDIGVDKSDFISMNYSKAEGPRQADGSLPDFGFMRLSKKSRLIDKGIDVGLPFKGNAPDLGAYESSYKPTSSIRDVLNEEPYAESLRYYTVTEPCRVKIDIYGLDGRIIRSLVNGNVRAGTYGLNWDGKGMNGRKVANGIYMSRINIGNKSVTGKMMIVK